MAALSSETLRTYCIMCGFRCPVVCHLKDGKLINVTPDQDHPLGGVFCLKAAAAPEFVYDPARLKYPMKRTSPKTSKDPGWVRISWEEAFDTIAEEMLEARSRYGAESIVTYRPAYSGSPSSDYDYWARRLAHAFGTPNTAMTTHICNWHRDNGSVYTYGVGAPEPDYEKTDCIIMWGSNPHSTGVRHAFDIAKAVKRGAKLIVVDPKKIALSKHAAVHLYVRPGSDLALILGLINQLIVNGMYDKAFVTRWTNAPFLIRSDNGRPLTEADVRPHGSPARYIVWDMAVQEISVYNPEKVSFDSDSVKPLLEGEVSVKLNDGMVVSCTPVFTKLRELTSTYSAERTSNITGASIESIVEAAKIIGASDRVCYYTGNGPEQHTDAMQTNRALCILYALTGDFDRKGGMVIYPDLPMNPVEASNLLPPEVEKRRLGVEKRPLGPASPRRTGWGGHRAVQPYEIYDAILTGKPYPVKVLISFGGNLIVSNGDSKRGAEALQKLDFYAHIDLYENPTSRFADLLLPAASCWESETVGKYEWRDIGHVQMRCKVVASDYERVSDLEVIFRLAKKLGLSETFFEGDMEAAFNYMLSPLGKTVSDIRSMPAGMTVSLPAKYEKYKEIDAESNRTRGFNTPSRLIEIYSNTFADYGYDPLPNYVVPPERNLDENKYPLLLTASKPKPFTHGSYRSVPSLRKQLPEPLLEINPKTALERGIEDGEWVLVETPKGSIRAKAKLQEDLLPDVVCGQEGWWQACDALGLPGYDPLSETGANLNLIIGNELIDPISGSVPHRGQPCQVRRLQIPVVTPPRIRKGTSSRLNVRDA